MTPVARKLPIDPGALRGIYALYPPGGTGSPIGGVVQINSTRWAASISGTRREGSTKAAAVAATWAAHQEKK